jgi:16S rRNA (cytosine1402-N4)-methyltransferase
VLLEESVAALEVEKGGIFVDATFGGGGHTSEILRRMPSGRLIVFDRIVMLLPICLKMSV